MSDIKDWANLRCECGSELFQPIYHLRWKVSGGTTTQPVGHKCAACGMTADAAAMIHLVEINRRRQELKALEAEVAASAPKKETAAAGRG